MLIQTQNINANQHKIRTLKYPAAWFPESDRLTLEDRTRLKNETIQFIFDCGIYASQWATRLEAVNIEQYVGLTCYSFFLFEKNLVYAKYISAWIVWDDDVVEKITDPNDPHLTKILQVFRADRKTLTEVSQDPYIEMYRRIMLDLLQFEPNSVLLDYFFQSKKNWIDLAVQECRFKSGLGKTMSSEEYLQCRSETVGIKIMMIIMAILGQIQLTNSFFMENEYPEITELFSHLVLFQNELASMEKDAQQNYPNLVNLIAQEQNISVQEVIESIIERHDHCVIKVEKLLEKWSKEPYIQCPDVQSVVQLCKWFCMTVVGFGFYHAKAPRYIKSVLEIELV